MDAEFKFRFVDSNGSPVPGVRLDVYNSAGAPAEFFPVTDFSRSNRPTSNTQGIMYFRHIKTSQHEMSGSCWNPFFILRVGACDAPVFRCDFTLGKGIIATYRYDTLDKLVSQDSPPLMRKRIDFEIPDDNPFFENFSFFGEKRLAVDLNQIEITLTIDRVYFNENTKK